MPTFGQSAPVPPEVGMVDQRGGPPAAPPPRNTGIVPPHMRQPGPGVPQNTGPLPPHMQQPGPVVARNTGIIPPHMQQPGPGLPQGGMMGAGRFDVEAKKLPAAGGNATSTGAVGMQNGMATTGVPRAPAPPATNSQAAQVSRANQAAAVRNGRPITRRNPTGRPAGFMGRTRL